MARKKSNLLNNELVNFKGFQESQISVLNSIASSLESNLEISRKLESSLDSIMNNLNNMTNKSKNLESEKLKFLEQMQKREKDIHEQYSNHRIRSIQKEEQAISDALNTFKNLGDKANEIDLERLKRQVDELIESENKKLEQEDKQRNVWKILQEQLLKLAWHVGKTANKFSELSNSLIQISGESGADVRDARSNMVKDTIYQLNKETGWFFNPTKSYETMISIAKEANIGSLEVIQELTRPMLIASEALEINNAELAGLFSKWYTRYNFSSSAMEEMVDEIRGNTKGNNATAEATIEAMSKFQNWMGNYTNSEEEMRAIQDAISANASRIAATGADPGQIFDHLLEIGRGDTTNIEQIQTLLYKGAGLEWTQAVDLLRSGTEEGFTEVFDAILKGYTNTYGNLKNSYVSGTAMEALGVDNVYAEDLYSALNAIMSPEEFESSTSGTQSAVDSINDKFNTWSDKLLNRVDQIAASVANFQEFSIGKFDMPAGTDLLGLGTFIASLVGAAGGGKAVKSMLSKATSGVMRSTAGGAGLATLGGGAALGSGGMLATGTLATLSSVASAILPALGIIAGVGGVAYLVKKVYDEATELSGNAEVVSGKIQSIGESLEQERMNRLEQLGDLKYEFSQAKDLNDKINILKESGLFSEEELIGKNESQLEALISSYESASKAMDEVTDNLLETAQKKYEEILNREQNTFIADIADLSSEDKANALKVLAPSAGEYSEKLMKYAEDGKVNWFEWMRASSKIKDAEISTDTMRTIDGLYGFGRTYTDASDIDNAVKSYRNLMNTANTEEFDDMMNTLKEDEESYRTFRKIVGDSPEALRDLKEGYAFGSNYIRSNRLAMIHEGEAIVPKKYNPQANMTELEMLRKYYKDSSESSDSDLASSMREFKEILSEIKSFLAYWREDNLQREMARGNSAMDYNLYNVARYNLY